MKILLTFVFTSAAFLFGAIAQENQSLTMLGYLRPVRNIDMNFAEAGVVGEIHVREGDTVSEGDPLVSLDNRVLLAQIEIARVQAASEAGIKVAQAELNEASDRLSKLYRLKRSGTAHDSEVSRAVASQQMAEGRLSIAEEQKQIAGFQLQEIEAQIERRILRSPIEGVVLEINLDVSEAVTTQGGAEKSEFVAKVARIDQLEFVVFIPSDSADGLQVGQMHPVKVLSQSSLQRGIDGEGVVTEGRIDFISPVIDPSSETVRTRLIIDNEEGQFKSGAHALLILEKAPASSGAPSVSSFGTP
ncbi:MAG: efflux RND transporter periplasmic adaptor subunit [Verrucomicrobiota bacterium]